MSRAVWAEVFPPDRDEVFRRAAMLIRRGLTPDEAVRTAADMVADAALCEGNTALSRAVLRLSEVFPGRGRDRDGRLLPPLVALARAAVAAAREGKTDPSPPDLPEIPTVDRNAVAAAFTEAAGEAAAALEASAAAAGGEPDCHDSGSVDPDGPASWMDADD